MQLRPAEKGLLISGAALIALVGAYGLGVWWSRHAPLPEPPEEQPLELEALSGAVAGFRCVEGAEVGCREQLIFHGLRRYGEASRRVWAGKYRFDAWPLCLVYGIDEDAFAGYLIRPRAVPSGATRLGAAGAQGLGAVYRYDGMVRRAVEQSNGAYAHDFQVEGERCPMVFYSHADAQAMADGSRGWLNTALHETFHAYQDEAWAPTGWIQDAAGYPTTAPVLALSLLEMRIALAAAQTDERGELRRLLGMAVAARARKIAVDPTGLVERMDNGQEHGEGTARYVELAVQEALEPGARRRAHVGELEVMLGSLDAAPLARSFLTWGMWYETGGIMVWTLERLGVSVVSEVEEGRSPWEVARGALNLSEEEQAAALDAAWTRFGRSRLEAEASRLAEMMEVER